MLRQVPDLSQRNWPLQQRRRADRRQLFVEQLAHSQPMVGCIAIDHSRIETFTAKVHPMLHCGGQLHWHIRPQRLPLHQPWQQPAHHAGWGLELQGGIAPANLAHALFDQAKDLLYPRQPILALAGQAQAAGLALKQGITQMLFKPGNLTADGALGDVELLCSAGEIAMLGRDQKGVKRWQGR